MVTITIDTYLPRMTVAVFSSTLSWVCLKMSTAYISMANLPENSISTNRTLRVRKGLQSCDTGPQVGRSWGSDTGLEVVFPLKQLKQLLKQTFFQAEVLASIILSGYYGH